DDALPERRQHRLVRRALRSGEPGVADADIVQGHVCRVADADAGEGVLGDFDVVDQHVVGVVHVDADGGVLDVDADELGVVVHGNAGGRVDVSFAGDGVADGVDRAEVERRAFAAGIEGGPAAAAGADDVEGGVGTDD